MCCWLKSSTNGYLCENSFSLEKTFLKDFKEGLSGNDSPSDGNGSLLHDVEVKRLALQVLVLSDVGRTLLPENERWVG